MVLPRIRPEPSADGIGSDAPPEVLPLRLSVTRNGLQVELAEPLSLGVVSITELEVAFPQVAFPIDLSRGVKQFRNHRGSLCALKLSLDLERLQRWLLESLPEALGTPLLGARVRANSFEGARVGPRPGGTDLCSTETAASLSVSLFGLDRGLCFDLVLSSRESPCFIVDAARGLGLPTPPMVLALRLVEQVLGAGAVGAIRQGRSVTVEGLCRRLCSEIFPSLGFRIPQMPESMAFEATSVGADFGFSARAGAAWLGAPGPSARAIRLRGLATLATSADELLARGELDDARNEYLHLLEAAPNHAEVLCHLAEIDAYASDRAQSALGLLGERRRGELDSTDVVAALVAVQALRSGWRPELYTEALAEAAKTEHDGALRALLLTELATRLPPGKERRARLDCAINACPSHPRPRWERLALNLTEGDLPAANLDAQQLEAGASPAARASVLTRLGEAFAAEGWQELSAGWFGRALVLSPDELELKLRLANTLEHLGRKLEAAELYQAALATQKSPVSNATLERVFARARLSLARIVATETSDLRLALSYLRDISSRAPSALEARCLEASLAIELDDHAARRSARLRLLEAIELGWIAIEKDSGLLQAIEREERAFEQADIADFAARLASDARVRSLRGEAARAQVSTEES